MTNAGVDFFLELLKQALNWYIWLPLLLIAAFKTIPGLIEANRLSKAGLPEIDRMDGLAFEKYLEGLFRRLGYQVERTRYVGDKGADLILTKGSERVVVQAKRHRQKVGNKAVQEAYAAMPVYGCNRAMVVTNSEFTRDAIEHARACNVELWGRSELAAKILALQGKGEPVAATPIAASRQAAPAKPEPTPLATSVPTCQRCGKPMAQRRGARGSFWGCSGYPKCRFTLEIRE